MVKVLNIIIIILYEGDYLDGLRNGMGKEYDEDGELLFEGNYLKGEIQE